MAGQFRPDVLIGVDVNHDYDAAPGVSDKRFPAIEMGKGFTISTGSITAPALNNMLEDLACKLPCFYPLYTIYIDLKFVFFC